MCPTHRQTSRQTMEHVMCSNSLHLCDDVTQPPLFYGHYASQPMLAGTSNWRILLVHSFIARMPLLAATSAFGFWRRHWSSPQQCYQQ